MTRASPALSTFNAGELSPQLVGRTDIAKYPNGCKVMENFLATIQGPAQRRGGSRFIQATKSGATKRSWFGKFEFNATQNFVLEFGDLYIRFYANHGQLLTGAVTAWGIGTNYLVGDLAERLGVNYYCILPHVGNQPPNATYWYPLTGSIYEVPSPYALADLTNADGAFALSIEQSGDVLYIAHPIHVTRTLTRYADALWVLTFYQNQPDPQILKSPRTTSGMGNGPFLEQNVDDGIAIWAVASSIDVVQVVANAALFQATDTGGRNRLLRIESQSIDVVPWETNIAVAIGVLRRFDGKTYRATNAATTGTSPPVHESGTVRDGATGVFWEFQDAGYGIVRIGQFNSSTDVLCVVLQRLPAAVFGVVRTITAITAANPPVVTTSAAHTYVTGDTVYIFGVVGMTQVNNKFFTVGVTAANTFELAGVVGAGFSAYVSGGTSVKNATKRWRLGAWSDTTEYPRAAGFFEDRLFLGGRLRVWGSVPGDYSSHAQDFFGLVTPDAAISAIVTSKDVAEIQWIIGADKLLIGTSGGEFAGGAITTVEPLGPGNFKIQRQSKRRCRAVQPELVGTSLLYAQRTGRKLLLLDYAFEVEKYRSSDQTVLANHIARRRIIDMAYQSEPDSVLWCVLADGQLIAFTIDVEQDVRAWHRHPLGGNGIAEAVEVIPAPDGATDEVWVTVRRTINGATVRYVEVLERPWNAEDDDPEDAFYVDSGLTYSGVPADTISGLAHLEGQVVQVLADGATHPDRTVAAGAIELDREASVVHVGLKCAARLVTMNIEAGGQTGTAQGKIKRVHEAAVRLVDTLGGRIGMEGGTLDEIEFRSPSDPMDEPPPIFSGDKIITFPGDYDTNCRIEVLAEQPLPITLAAIYPKLRAYDS